MAMAERNIWNL